MLSFFFPSVFLAKMCSSNKLLFRIRSCQRTFSDFRPVIGLEVHVQLATKTKLFSASAVVDCPTTSSNSFVSHFDLALPGTLPSLSRSCVEISLSAAVLLNCEISDFCRFDRKHYFYPDLPLGYQITQKANPIAKNGFVDFFAQTDLPYRDVYKKRIRIQQIQLEMDSGKMIRWNQNTDLIDLNRAGVALIEIVTRPDFDTPFEVICFVEHLRLLLAHNGICAGHLHEGNLRVDANVSVSRGEQSGKKVELKNMSSISHLQSAISKELDRQVKRLQRGEDVQEETRAVDAHGKTVSARDKGSEMDYRFLRESNLPPMAIRPDWIEKAGRQARLDLPHLHYITSHGFPPMFAAELLKNERLSQLIQVYISLGKPLPFNKFWLWLEELQFLCQKLSIDYPPANAQLISNFAELIHLEFTGRLTKLVCIDLLREVATQDPPTPGPTLAELVERRQLWRIADSTEIDKLLEETIAEQPGNVMEKLSQLRLEPGTRNKTWAKLKRRVIEHSEKRASPEDVEAAIRRRIGQQTTKEAA